jgi:amidase
MSDGIRDTVNAFMAHGFDAPVAHAPDGPLSGLSFAVKDMYDVAGLKTGFGNPAWLEMAAPAAASNSNIVKLLDAGARFVGKTQCEELTFSLIGMNAHYPRPINPAAPDRVTGGSSSGSVAAVAAGYCDFAIGSDTGGSVRAPASFCGLYGLRPTHGVLPLDHACGLAPSFDTFGWFARDPETYRRIGDTLLPPDSMADQRGELVEPSFAEAFLEPASLPVWRAIRMKLGLLVEDVAALDGAFDNYMLFRRLQAYEAWALHGDFVADPANRVSPGIAERFRYGETLSCADANADTRARTALRDAFGSFLGDKRMLVLPTVPGPAPFAEASAEALGEYREKALHLLCISGLTGFPQMNVPAGTVDGAPLGLSVIGPAGSDRAVIDMAIKLKGILA